MFEKPEFEYIAISKTCGCIVGLVADVPGQEKMTAKSVSSFIKGGNTVERVRRDSDKFRFALENFGHKCEPAQESLL